MKGHAVVVGSGPAGSLASMYLARRGYKVSVYEKREREVLDPNIPGRTYAMILCSRALHPIERVGAQPAVLGPSAIPSGGAYHGGKKPTMGVSKIGDPYLTAYPVERLQFGNELVDEAKRLYGDQVTFHDGQALVGLDLESRTASFSKSTGKSTSDEFDTVNYDLLVGADGANSVVRGEMEKQVPGFSTKVLYDMVFEYKTVAGLPADVQGVEGYVPGFSSHRPMEYSYFEKVPGAPLVAIRKNILGSVNVIVAEWDKWDVESLSHILSTAYPRIPAAWTKEISEQMGGPNAVPASKGGRIIQCNQYHGPAVVLLGDAAHAVTPALGQGCNCALEGVQVFDQTLDACGDDLGKALPKFSAQRVPDAHALQYIELAACLATKIRPSNISKLYVLWAKLKFFPVAILGTCAVKLFPSYFNGNSPLSAMLRDRRWSYRKVNMVFLAIPYLLMAVVAVGVGRCVF